MRANIASITGLRAGGQPRDQISPPVAVILPGQPFLVYDATTDESLTINLISLLIITDAAPAEKTQRALDAHLGIGKSASAESIPAAVMADLSPGGTVHLCVPVNVINYGRIEYAGQTYFGARVNLQLGAI